MEECEKKSLEISGDKLDYLEFLKKSSLEFEDSLSSLTSRLVYAYQSVAWFAMVQALLYQHTREKAYAKRVKQLLMFHQRPERVKLYLYPRAYAYISIKDSEVLTTEEEKEIKGDLVKQAMVMAEGLNPNVQNRLGMRVYNHALAAVAGCKYIALKIASGREANKMNSFSEEIWNECWSIRDNPEDATNYEPMSLLCLIQLAELQGNEDEFYQDSITHNIFERYLQQLSPLGVEPNYGDGGWASQWGHWIAVFEKAARVYRDGRFKWAARRIFDYAVRNKYWKNAQLDEKNPSYVTHALTHQFMMDLYGVACAYLLASDEIKQEIPRESSLISYRYLPNLEFSTTARPAFEIGIGERRENKLILRGGWNEDDPFLVINLLKKMWHAHHDNPAIILFTCNGSVLLHDTSYYQGDPEFHNLLYVQEQKEKFLQPDLSERSIKAMRSDYWSSMRFLSDLSRVTFASIKSSNYFGYPINSLRTLIFSKDNPIVAVHDRVNIQGGRYWLAPLWHTQKILSRGKGYFDTQQEFMRGHLGPFWSNKSHNLLVVFPLSEDKVGEKLQENKRAYREEEIPLHEFFLQKHCLYQSALAKEGQTKDFISLLIPHTPETNVKELVEKIRVLSCKNNSFSIEVVLDKKEIVLVFNGERELSNKVLTTDAMAMYILKDISGAYCAFHEASKLVYHQECLFQTRSLGSTRPGLITPVLTGEIFIGKNKIEGKLFSSRKIEVDIYSEKRPVQVLINGKMSKVEYSPQEKSCRIGVRNQTDFVLVQQ